MRFWPLLLLLCACPAAPVVQDGGVDAGSEALDGSIPFDAGARPSGPIAGELTLWQLDLPSGLVPKTGESAILIGPDGTLVLLDVGNSNHDDEVRAAVRELNTTWLTPARGYRARGPRAADWAREGSS